MSDHKSRLKKLQSMKKDIFSRISEKNLNTKALASSIQPKLNKFVLEIGVIEQEFYSETHTDKEIVAFSEEIDELRKESELIQEKLQEKKEKIENDSNEDQILSTLAFLKEISNEMLIEINSQNNMLEKKLKGVDTQKHFFQEKQSGLSKSEQCIDIFPTSCLISTMCTLALTIILLMSLL